MALKKRKTPKPKLADDPKVKEAAAFVMRGVAAQKAVDEVAQRTEPKPRIGPSKTQVFDAIRGVSPGLPAAQVSAIASVIMALYR